MSLLDNQDMVNFFTDYFGRAPTEQDLLDIQPSFTAYEQLQWNQTELTGDQIEVLNQQIYVPMLKKKVAEAVTAVQTVDNVQN